LGLDIDGDFAPFYVGQSSRVLGRIADYQKANFSARTDFKVGETVSFFLGMNQNVKIAFKESADPERDEKHWIDEAKARGYLLLNLFNLETDDENEARDKVHRRANEFLEHLQQKLPRARDSHLHRSVPLFSNVSLREIPERILRIT